MRRVDFRYIAGAVLLLFIVIQFIQPDRTNPAIEPSATYEALAKPSPQVASMLKRACADCHSNSTNWPWYSKVAPASWLVASDVQRGRVHLNFSEWNRLGQEMAQKRLAKACSEMKRGEMPLWQYTLVHRDSKITPADIEAFCSSVPR